MLSILFLEKVPKFTGSDSLFEISQPSFRPLIICFSTENKKFLLQIKNYSILVK